MTKTILTVFFPEIRCTVRLISLIWLFGRFVTVIIFNVRQMLFSLAAFFRSV